MKIKTSELTGNALNWAVNHAEGLTDMLAPVNYCGKWEFGGPIIGRERTEFDFNEDTQLFHAYDGVHSGIGPDHLIAACRCYVASKLGDEVDVPEELT